MESYLDQDIQYLVDNLDILHELNGKNILITGATGLIGSCIVKTLCKYDAINSVGLHVFAFVRNKERAEKVFASYLTNPALVVVIGDVNNIINISDSIDYIIHGASVTSSKKFVECPVETINTLITGTNNILSFAKHNKTSKTLFLSSLEVYGIPGERYQVFEDYVGFIDFSNIRSSYSEGKRLAECLCYSYAKEYNLFVSVARLAQTFGPGVAYDDGRVFAQFARCVIDKKNIELNTAGRTYRNYCYLRDAVSGILYVLLKGENGTAYNIANKNTGITISEMADLVCGSAKLGNGRISVVYNNLEDVNEFGYNPEMKIELITDKLERLGWKAEVDLEEMYIRMIKDMKNDV